MNATSKVTIERGDGLNGLVGHVGRKATVIKVIGPIAIIDIEDVGYRGCLTEYLQPMITEEMLNARYAQTTEEAVG